MENDRQEERRKLDDLRIKARRILCRVDSVFPFDFFPDTILVDENKVDIIRRRFFATEDVLSVFIEDIRMVRVSTSLFFASMKFEIRGYEENPDPIGFLPKTQAMHVRRVIAGLAAAEKEKIDFAKLTASELAVKVEEIGRARELGL